MRRSIRFLVVMFFCSIIGFSSIAYCVFSPRPLDWTEYITYKQTSQVPYPVARQAGLSLGVLLVFYKGVEST
jgi:hypothetical protein